MSVNEMAGNGRRSAPVVDHSLHGLITIRLIGAPPRAVRELQVLLGPSDGGFSDRPDITIDFTRGLGARDGLRYIGLNEAAFDERGFYLLGGGAERATFDFERLGEPVEFACEPGATVFPYLLPVIALRLLRKGYVMLHSASMLYGGRGVLVTGWQKGGKTETLLAFMASGATFMSDEWTILSPSEGRMWGIPGTLQVWDWHLRQLPEYWGRLRPAERARLRLVRIYQRAYAVLPPGLRGSGLVGGWLRRLSQDGGVSLVGQVRSRPERLFGGRVWRGPADIDVLLLAGIAPDISVSPVDPAEVASRMAASLEYERRSLMARYQQFRYAFPDRRNAFLETASERERDLLEQTLIGRRCYEVRHPYPVALENLYAVCAPLIAGGNQEPSDEAVSTTLGAKS